MKREIKLVQLKDSEHFTLEANGKAMICPFKTMAPAQNNIGSITWLTHDCNTMCPLLDVKKDSEHTATGREIEGTEHYRITVNCGSRPTELFADIKENKPGSNLTLVN